MPWSPRRRSRGFTLIELAIALAVVAMLAAALAIPLTAQLQLRRADEARRQLEEARDVLLGFAVAQGRLPCPATEASRGEEAFAPGGGAANGACADFHSGFLPGAALGMSPLDASGFMRDPWAGEANRVRYAVHSGTVNGVSNALTRANGMQLATLAGLGDAAAYLFVCVSGDTAGPAGCGPAANQLTRKAAFVLLSLGPNAHAPPAAGFDDVVHWGSIHLVIHRMVAAGRLP